MVQWILEIDEVSALFVVVFLELLCLMAVVMVVL
jgi:hypothetical protein